MWVRFYNPAMTRKTKAVTCCLAGLLLLLGACSGEEAPSAAVPGETVTAEPAATEVAPAPDVTEGLAHEFPPGTELLTFDEVGLARNPSLAARDDGFRWGALVSREGQVAWVVDGEETPVGDGEVSEFVATADLSRYAYVSNDMVVVDGEREVLVGARYRALDVEGKTEARRQLVESLTALVGAISPESLVLALEEAQIETGDSMLVRLTDPEGESGVELEFQIGTEGRIVQIRRLVPSVVVDPREEEVGTTGG